MKLIIFDAPMHDTSERRRSLDDVVQAIRVLDPDLVLVDCAGPGRMVLSLLRLHGVNAAALPKVPR